MRFQQLALFCVLLCSDLQVARAETGPDADAMKAAVEKGLLQPLARRDSERSRFARARMPPSERRVRMTDGVLHADARGEAFSSFTVDIRWGSQWNADLMTGCIYPGTGAIYVKQGEGYLDGSALMGKKASAAPPEACKAAAPSDTAS
jgi:hypothetical protein